ncbi:hypothetical protein AK812_SmicGene32915 [Symbiodinium microadriaticum]|uniref:Uncharacterized protein n=1 Tax=Symbiodinium microadriaticum TaxID=2951 RepID=A0A1Q9CSZ5_SYMMI|nr:hypothetical protein AK812_SmicGene32915 [Symbiodinium microadriaticum]
MPTLRESFVEEVGEARRRAELGDLTLPELATLQIEIANKIRILEIATRLEAETLLHQREAEDWNFPSYEMKDCFEYCPLECLFRLLLSQHGRRDDGSNTDIDHPASSLNLVLCQRNKLESEVSSLASLWREIEVTGKVPSQMGLIEQWLHKHRDQLWWDCALPSRSTHDAALRRGFSYEEAHVDRVHRCSLFVDLSTFYEGVDHLRLCESATRAGLLLYLAMVSYRGGRIIVSDEIASPTAYARKGLANSRLGKLRSLKEVALKRHHGMEVTFVLQTVEFLSSVVGATGACIDHLEVPKDQGAARGGFFAVSPQSSPLASLGAAAHVREAPQAPFPEVPSCWVARVRRSKTVVEVPRGPRIQLPPGAIPIPERKAAVHSVHLENENCNACSPEGGVVHFVGPPQSLLRRLGLGRPARHLPHLLSICDP